MQHYNIEIIVFKMIFYNCHGNHLTLNSSVVKNAEFDGCNIVVLEACIHNVQTRLNSLSIRGVKV